MTTHLISSQRYLDDSIVAAKVADGVFEVRVSPEFEVDGETYQVILDGHHAFAAARLAGVAPVVTVMDKRDHDAIALLERGEVEDFLEVTHLGDDYYFAATGQNVWQ